MKRITEMNKGKRFSKETIALQRDAALGRKHTLATKQLMSINNNKSVAIVAYVDGVEYKKFDTITSAALFFFNDSNKRGPIRYALEKNKLLLGKYELKKNK